MINMVDKKLLYPQYVYSPFDKTFVDGNTETTAITMIGVFGLLFLVGFVGQLCVLKFTYQAKNTSSSQQLSAYAVFGSIALSHLFYVIICLPLDGYKALMGLISEEWVLGEAACRSYSFLKVYFLCLTALNLIYFAADRCICAYRLTKTEEPQSKNLFRKTAFKLIFLWILAIVLALPKIFLASTEAIHLPVADYSKNGEAENSDSIQLITKTEYNLYRNTLINNTQVLKKSSVKYHVLFTYCNEVQPEKSNFSSFVKTALKHYVSISHWWLFGFYFCFPIFISLFIILATVYKLASIESECKEMSSKTPQAGYHLASGVEANSITSYQAAVEGSSLVNIPETPQIQNETTNCHSNHENSVTSLQQHETVLHRQTSYSSSLYRYHHRMSPLISSGEIQGKFQEQENTFSLKRLNGSKLDNDSTLRSPLSPSLTCASRISVLSMTTSNAAGITTSVTDGPCFPFHGHRKVSKRFNIRTSRLILQEITSQKRLLFVFVALLFVFAITQFPLHGFDILTKETGLIAKLDKAYLNLAHALVQYLYILTFILNPIVFCFVFGAYRYFLSNCCCSCC